MSKIWLVIKREYLVKVRKKSFIIMTILAPLLMASLIILPAYLSMQGQEERVIAVNKKEKLFSSKLKDTDFLHFVIVPEFEIETIKSDFSLSPYYAILEIDGMEKFTLYSDQQISLSVRTEIEEKLSNIIEKEKLRLAGIDTKTLEDIETNTKIETIIIGENGETSGNAEASLGIGFMCGILIYMFIFMYGTMVMRSVIEEKTNRIVEVIISSIKPFELMMGKILGVIMVGLTQFLLWILLTIILSSVGEAIFFDLTTISSENITSVSDESLLIAELSKYLSGINLFQLIFSFIFYFFGGYLLYSALFAAVGSAVDAEADTQQFILPITIPLILSFLLIQLVMENPDGSLAYWLSLIPFTSPVIMMVRLPFGVSNIELIVSMLLLVAGFLSTTLLAAKIYRTGILMYGKKASYKELWKWLTYRG